MTGCLETGSHLCHGCVTGASRHSPGETPLSIPRPPLVPGRRPAYPPSRTASQPLPARLCVTRCAACRLSAPVPNLSGACRRLPVGWTILERVIDKRPQADRLLVAEIYGEARRRARWRDLSSEEEAAAVAELRTLAGGRADLLAEVAGILEGASRGRAGRAARAPGREAVPQGRGRPGGDPGVDRGRPPPGGEREAAAVLRWPARRGSAALAAVDGGSHRAMPGTDRPGRPCGWRQHPGPHPSSGASRGSCGSGIARAAPIAASGRGLGRLFDDRPHSMARLRAQAIHCSALVPASSR